MSQPLPVLSSRFRAQEHYQAPFDSGYTLLPFRFTELDANRFAVSNIAGEFVALPKQVVRDLIAHRLDTRSTVYNELKSRHILMDSESTVAVDLLATKYRTKQGFLSQFTSLFLFVVTLRCDHSCPYCQVSRQSADRAAFDMAPDVALKAIDFMFRTPSPHIKVEFQGGESLLNFQLIRQIVEVVESRNQQERRDISFVIATNLSPLTAEHLEFCRAHNVRISTSLDGPRQLHNANRPRPDRDSYERTIDGIRRVREHLGHDAVAALMTTTEASLSCPEAIIDEYVAQGFSAIFLRSISPYGFAIRTGVGRRYKMNQWLDFYRKGLTHIIKLNRAGKYFREEFASIILTKMLTPWNTGYVDLQSPAGIGISCLVFNYDGDIYASDESRMLAEMGDKTFRLGNLRADLYEKVMRSPMLLDVLMQTMNEGVPMCSDCAFLPWCGADPVFHHATQGDFVGFKPSSLYCQKNMSVMRHLMILMEDDAESGAILRSWVR